jgi:hypothetical protein
MNIRKQLDEIKKENMFAFLKEEKWKLEYFKSDGDLRLAIIELISGINAGNNPDNRQLRGTEGIYYTDGVLLGKIIAEQEER